MKKYIFITILAFMVIQILTSCSPIRKSLDKKNNFTGYLNAAQSSVVNENWDDAISNLEESKKAWQKIKPLIQVEVDHDYIYDIESNFIRAKGFLKTKDKSESLVNIMLIKETWADIGSR